MESSVRAFKHTSMQTQKKTANLYTNMRTCKHKEIEHKMIQTHKHTNTHTKTQTHAQTCKNSNIRACRHNDMQTCRHVRKHRPRHTNTQAYKHAKNQTYKCTLTYAPNASEETDIHADGATDSQSYKSQTCKHAHMQTYKNKNLHT